MDIPYLKYPITDNKQVCRVCKRKLSHPGKRGSVFYADESPKPILVLYNRAVCSFNCFSDLFDDYDELIDVMYDIIYKCKENDINS